MKKISYRRTVHDFFGAHRNCWPRKGLEAKIVTVSVQLKSTKTYIKECMFLYISINLWIDFLAYP